MYSEYEFDHGQTLNLQTIDWTDGVGLIKNGVY